MLDDLVPYYMDEYYTDDKKKMCPSYFNDHRRVGPVPGGEENPYGINTADEEIVPKA